MPSGRVEEARRFYCGVLGLREKNVPRSLGRGLMWLEAGVDELELHLFPDRDEPHERAHLALAVEDLAGLRTRLEEHGYAIEDTVPIPNRPRCFCHDPFGNRIELTELRGPYE